MLAASNDGIDVAANHSVVTLTELQRPGGKRLAAGDFLRGFALQPGMVFAKRESECFSSVKTIGTLNFARACWIPWVLRQDWRPGV